MSLKEIMEMHPKLEEKIKKLGFDFCCSKMDSLAESCKKKNVNLDKVLKVFNKIVDELNLIERLTNETENWR